MKKEKIIKEKNKIIILELALQINEELFNEKKINYQMFKYTEENILKKLKNIN